MRRIALTGSLLRVLLLGTLVGTGSAAAQERFPGWFLQTPEAAAVGYAPVYAYAASTMAEAERSAREALALGRHVKIYGEQLFETRPDGSHRFRGAWFDELALDPQPELVGLDTAFVDGMVLVLASTRRHAVSRGEVPMPREAPQWVTDLEGLGEGVYAVGVVPRSFYPHTAWRAAEAQARRNLAFQGLTEQRSLETRDGAVHGGAASLRTAAVLVGTRIVARWANGRSCYVLARADAVVPQAPVRIADR